MGFAAASPAMSAGAGTVSVTGNAITGVGTAFSAGGVGKVFSAGYQWGILQSVSSTTSATLDRVFTFAAGAGTPYSFSSTTASTPAYITQSGSYWSKAVTGINLTSTQDAGVITFGSAPTIAFSGHAFAIVRAGVVIGVRCAASVAGNTMTYHRLYDELTGLEIATNIAVGDTIAMYELPTLAGTGSALSANASVTYTGYNTASTFALNDFVISALGLNIGGYFQISDRDRMTFDVNAPSTSSAYGTIQMTAGGRLAVGQYTTLKGVSTFADTTPIRMTNNSGQSTNYFIYTSTAASGFDWFGGTIEAGAPYGDVVNSTPNVYSQKCVWKTPAVAQFRVNTVSGNIYGLTLENGAYGILRQPAILRNVKTVGCNPAFSVSSAAPINTWYPLTSITFAGNVIDVGFWTSQWVRLINSPTGSNVILAGNQSASNAQNRGLTEIRQNVFFNITDAGGAGLTNARIFCRDTNNDNRLAANVFNSNPSYTPDNTYEATTTSGSASFVTNGGVLLAACYQNVANVACTQYANIVWDYRSTSNSNADLFTFSIAKYGYLPVAQSSALKGGLGTTITRGLLQDLAITQSNMATVAAYTTLETANKLYDYQSYWVQQSGANMEIAGAGKLLASLGNGIINIGAYNLVIDAAAESVFSIAGNTITIKASTFTGNITTTGTVTLANGATINGSYTDSTGSHVVLTITGISAGSDVVVKTTSTSDGSGSNVLQAYDAISGTSVQYQYVYTSGQAVNISVYKPGYRDYHVINYTLGSSPASLPVSQLVDRNYV